MALSLRITPAPASIARCIHAEQSVTFIAEDVRRLRTNPVVRFVLVPLNDLQHAAATGWQRGQWLVWDDHTKTGDVVLLPAGGAAYAGRFSPADPKGELACAAMNDVVDAAWRLVAD